jgi:tetratricopeptide (TPR) repeat protein
VNLILRKGGAVRGNDSEEIKSIAGEVMMRTMTRACSAKLAAFSGLAGTEFILAMLVLAALALPVRADPLEDCSSRGDPQKRIDACSAVIDGSYGGADKARAYRIRGEARLSAGASEQAIADFTQAIALAPRESLSHAGRGQALLTRGDAAGAIVDLSEAIRLAPDSAFYRNARGHAHLVAGEPGDAAEDFSESIRLDPKSASAHNNRGLARSKLGSTDAAIADYTAAIVINPLYALAYNNRAYAYEAKGAKTEAMADFRRALQIDPTLAGARAGLERLGAKGESVAETDRLVSDGKKLAEKNCAWCHATGAKGQSSNPKAPPFRTIASRYPVLALREPLSRGIAAPHDQMPNFKLPDADVDKIIAYIDSLARSP